MISLISDISNDVSLFIAFRLMTIQLPVQTLQLDLQYENLLNFAWN